MLSRRRLITAGATAGAVSVLPPQLIKAATGSQAGSAQVGDVTDYVAITTPSDVNFHSKLDNLFPGLLKDPTFQKIQSHAILISNIGDQIISAYSTHWKATTATGGYETTLLHYFHPTARRHGTAHFGLTGNRTRFTGKVPLLSAGATRLVTPYFNWSPNYYRKNPQPQWKKILSETASRQFFLYELSNATAVQVTVDALIVNQQTLIGNDSGKLGKAFSLARNAEHDEAVSIRRQLRKGASHDQIAKFLQSHTYGALSPQALQAPHLYQEVRQRQAAVLLRRLKHAAPAQFVKTLRYLAHKPKTSVGI